MFKVISLSLHAVTLAGLAFFASLHPPASSAVDQEARDVISTIADTQKMQGEINKNTQTTLANDLSSIRSIHETLLAQCRINNRLLRINVACDQ